MSSARLSDGLLPASSTIAMVDLLARRPDGAAIDHLLQDLAATTTISWSRARNTISKLIAFGLFEPIAKASVRLADRGQQDWQGWITKQIVSELTDILTRSGTWSCIGRDPTTEKLMIDAMTLPPIRDGLAMWVTDFGIAQRTAIQTRFWIVTDDYTEAFLTGAMGANKTTLRRAKSAERLAADLERQAEAGAAAEAWVVKFERERLRDHPFCDQIRQVSTEDVAAGYDIVSFDTNLSLHHDRFIEVKSHGKQKVFHWSRNEIATALEFGEAYALYLVDRDRCEQPGYAPQMITGPTPEMFSLPGSGWRVEATSFEHIAIAK